MVNRFTPPKCASTPSARSRSRTDDRASTTCKRTPATLSSSGKFRKHVRAVHVHQRRGGKVQHNEPGRRGFGAHSIQNRVAHVIHVEINETRLRPEDQNAGNQLIVRVALAIREPPRARDAAEQRDVRSRRAADQEHERDDCADHHAAQQARTQHPAKAAIATTTR